MKFELNFKEIGTNEDIVTWHGEFVPRLNEHVILKARKYMVRDVECYPPGDTVQLIILYVRQTK
jgi:hypothetical protein